ncbi:LSU ribosomal protein L25p [hydrothermal vent metagenome]|uniref:LSU ribosomal protein L25p n=1 Tax=hydrothermal vent metagenome TaxID=652676 RepID=A0A3B1CNC6_9ZZZZ
MERITLSAEHRTEAGKGIARSLRRQGYMPAVIYRAGKATPIKLKKQDIVNFLNSTMGEQVMVNLQFSDGNLRLALLKDYQVDPVKGELLHTDFYEVSLKERVRVTVSIVLTGEPVGVKKEGGILQQAHSELEIECLPDIIPSHLEIDVSGLKVGHSLHVSDLSLQEGIKVFDNPEEVIATVIAPAMEVEAVATEEAETAEPEVIKKGKKEEAEEG